VDASDSKVKADKKTIDQSNFFFRFHIEEEGKDVDASDSKVKADKDN
jgi:hypothetical protein